MSTPIYTPNFDAVTGRQVNFDYLGETIGLAAGVSAHVSLARWKHVKIVGRAGVWRLSRRCPSRGR